MLLLRGQLCQSVLLSGVTAQPSLPARVHHLHAAGPLTAPPVVLHVCLPAAAPPAEFISVSRGGMRAESPWAGRYDDHPTQVTLNDCACGSLAKRLP